MMFLPLLAALAVLEPDGWVEHSAMPSEFFGQLPLEARAFHPPNDPDTLFLVVRSDEPPDTTKLVDQVVARVGGQVLMRTHVVSEGRTIDSVRFVLGDRTLLHLRLSAGRVASRFQILGAVCRGRGPAFDACDARLAMVTVDRDAEPDLDGFKQLLYAIAASIILLTMIGLAIRAVLRRRRLVRSPRLADGEVVTVAGVVRALGPPIEAPLSGRSCVLHRSRIRVFTPKPLDRSETAGVAFVVETKQGIVRIATDTTQLAMAPLTVVDRASPRQLAFRQRHGIAVDVPVAFDEIVVPPGAKVMVRGIVRAEPDEDPTAERGYRDNAPTALHLAEPTVLRVW